MSTENKYTPHVHAEAIKAWADGKPIEWREHSSLPWSTINYPRFLKENEYRAKPEEVVDYTVVFDSRIPAANFRTTKEEIWQYYQNTKDKQGFMKRTTIDGKVVALEFIPR